MGPHIGGEWPDECGPRAPGFPVSGHNGDRIAAFTVFADGSTP
jgi:hypothetical protein